MLEEHGSGGSGGSGGTSPAELRKVDDIFADAVARQLAEQRAHRESVAEVGRRLEVAERVMADGLAEIAKLAHASEGEIERLGVRIEALESTVREGLGALEETLMRAVAGLFRPEPAGEYQPESPGGAVVSRLDELEGSLRKFEEQTTDQLADIRAASTAAEAGILERLIVESQTVAAHFDAVRPAVEAVVQAQPELETTLSELREIAERVRHGEGDPGETGPYTASELVHAHDDTDADNDLFQPPEETKIPDRRFGLRRER
ncbi:MAG: hypothetical protein ACRDY7_17510 [Acidimicrobiia bacterium]